jgi:hypothetical protein
MKRKTKNDFRGDFKFHMLLILSRYILFYFFQKTKINETTKKKGHNAMFLVANNAIYI